MSDYQLIKRCYVLPTPGGAFYAATTQTDEPAKRLLVALMLSSHSQLLGVPQVCKWTGLKKQDDVLDLLYRIQNLGWIQGEEVSRTAPTGTLEDILPELLESFSSTGKALLADSQGFYLASHGFSHETSEELSALSADLLALHERHKGLLNNNIGLHSEAWSVVDAAGNSRVGFWPLHIGRQRFVLVLSGVPHLNQLSFVRLVWVLSKRYNAISDSNVAKIRTDFG